MAAEFVLTFAAEGILTKVSSLAAQELALAWGFKAELEKLGESLSSIQDFLRGAAERPDDQGKAVEKWVKKLKQVAEDADDILDDFNYELLRRKVELHNHMKRKVLNFLSASNPLLFRVKMAHKIKKINDSLAGLKSQASFINLVAKKGDPRQRPDREQTDSRFEDGEKVVGREDDVTKIVTTLISSDNQQKKPSVMAIVGMAGLGKTTLAKSVYNEPAIDKHFPKKIWVCVSNTFEVDKILSLMVESLTKKPGMESRDALLQVLTEELTGKRYVLVLDDVWNKEKEKWDSLMSCLSKLNSNPGSCIIVTTRSTDVSTIAETLPRPELRNLSEEECWSIIKQRALNLDENGSIDAELERIGREIAEKCGGVPLVAKVLGSLLRSRASTVAEWSSIRDNGLWELPEGEERIMKVLKLSFDNLEPSPLKQCFAYCAVLGKDFEIERDNLIQLWMAQGLLQTSSTVENHHEMEHTGKVYFNILLNNSLFQEVIEGGTITKYTMHDLVHDLAEKVSKSERLNDVRHVARSRPPSTLENMSEVTVGRLRSLFSNDQVPEIIFSKFKAMRVLSLDTADIEELPNSFGKLKHLRYLDLSNTGIKALPKSIGKLYNLQTLRMRHCDLNKLPREMKNLINLRHLVLNGCNALSSIGLTSSQGLPSLPSGIENCTSLELLDVSFCRNLATISFTRVLPSLRILQVMYCINLSCLAVPEYCPSLQELRVIQCPKLASITFSTDLNPCLEELTIQYCNGLQSLPDFRSFTSLRELSIGSLVSEFLQTGLSCLARLENLGLGPFWEDLDSFPDFQVPSQQLVSLRLEGWPKLKSLPQQVQHLTSLTRLTLVSFEGVETLPEWLGNLASLVELHVYFCDNLKYLPSPEAMQRLTKLQRLYVFRCPLLEERCTKDSGEEWPKISHIPRVTFGLFKIRY